MEATISDNPLTDECQTANNEDDQEEIKITDTSHGHKKKKKNKKKKRKSAAVATDVVMDESCGENFPSSSGKDQPPNPTDHLSATTEVETTRPRTDSSIQLASILSSAVKDGEGDSNQEGSSTNKKKKKKKKKKKTERNASAHYLADDDPVNLQEPVHDIRDRHEDLEHAKEEDTALEVVSHQHLLTTMGDHQLASALSSAVKDGEGDSYQEGSSTNKKKKKKKKKKKTERNDSAQYLADDDPVNLQEPVHDIRDRHEDLEHAKEEETALEVVSHQHLLTTMGDQHATNYQNPNAEDASFVQVNSFVTNQKKKETGKENEEANPPSGSENGVDLAISTTATTSGEMTAVKDHMNAFPLRGSTEPASLTDTARPIQETDEGSTTTRQANREERNIMCIFKLVYGVGLRALRMLFMDINPSWTNKPSDAAGIDRGKMKLTKEEEASFNKGDINEWDFSLMTKVLLNSRSCVLEINKRPDFTRALQELRIARNRLLGHPSTESMSDDDFKTLWPHLSRNFVVLGADESDVADIIHQSDEVLYSGEYYKQRFLAEHAWFVNHKKKLDTMDAKLGEMDEKLDIIIANHASSSPAQTPVSPKDLSCPNWDEWLNFRDMVGDFQSHQNQYILVTDSLPSEDLEHFSSLRGVTWKMVLDFDPMSEEKGFYHEFTSKEGQSNLVTMITPAELRKSSMGSLLRQLDPQKTQWLFVNGRQSDTEGSAQLFPDWEATSVKHITRLFGCYSDPDKFDKQKPIVCVILPFREKSLSFLEVTLSRLIENFDEFKIQFVSFKHKFCHLISRKFEVRHFDLSPERVSLGLSEILGATSTQEYRMPSSQAGLPAKLTQNEFLYLKEHLQILYEGCEDLPEFSHDEAEVQNFFEEHRKSFISGNPISLVSLYDNHDARREIEIVIRSHVQRLLDQGLTRSVIVEIRHSPGTGGSTIARRVVWDLHKTHPCAILEITSSRYYFDDDNTLSTKFADRISALEELCHTSPLILIDGKHSGLIEALSNKLVRMLCNKGKRALLLRCKHGSKSTKRVAQESSHVHHVFDVNVKLEDSLADLNEFQSKYKEYIAQSLSGSQRQKLCRVFHFPLLAMMEEFQPKLKGIIEDTLDEMGGIQQEMAMVVAFLQKYANHATPAFLLYEAFKGYICVTGDKPITYKDIRRLFTEHLLNLMVPTDPPRPNGRLKTPEKAPLESYTLQHPLVADLVLKKVLQVQECDLFGIVNKFLQLPIYQHECFLPLFEELFLHNKYGRKIKFSILFEELKRIDSEHAARIFCEAAMKTNDAAVYANAARFLAKKEPPSFSKAKDLIESAFKANNSKVRLRSLYHTKGVVLFHEMKREVNSSRVKDLKELERLASEVLRAYHEARNFPPTYPHPLIGEVEVWLACIQWIMKNLCNRDSEKTLKFLTNQSPPFFRTCVSDSFNLLDIVDGICQSVPNLTDAEETQRLSNSARLSLISNFKRGLSVSGRQRNGDDLIGACKALCSTPNFPRSSQVELKKLQAHFLLSGDDPIDTLHREILEYLLKLLEDLVLVENDYRLAYHLMKVCVLVTGKRCYSLEQGLNVSEKWCDASPHDCLPYFYQMTIYFLEILDGNSLEFTPKYTKALRMCQEKSQNHFRSTQSTLFVGKGGQGMSRLITRNTLLRGETDYVTDDSDKVTKFWRVDSRRKLLECKGRIRVSEQSSGRRKSHLYIELVQGNLQLYVGKNADIGKVERDFNTGTLVYFVVSFNLHGPVANGITFETQEPSNN